MVQCKNLKVRQKQYRKYIWCDFKKVEISFKDCQECEFKDLKQNHAIKKTSNKRIVVNEETYQKIYARDNGICRLCGKNNIELHHIRYRSERKDLINDEKNCIMLCTECHQKVHSNKHYWQPKLLDLVEKLYKNSWRNI